ncbi:MAG: glycosyltransferase [Eubacteriales bacterium]|nr:glycosyltransferase [Eubacteriales bacterium]
MTDLKYSVLMPVYKGENAACFRVALESMLKQSVAPAEIVLVCDGPLTEELEKELETFQVCIPELLHLVRLPENQGIGKALAAGVQECSCELIARMDSDDIALPERCELQLEAFRNSTKLSLCSGTIAEFREDPQKTEALRCLPETQTEILRYAKRRNPMNHMAVMMRRSAVLAAGNYHDVKGAEDYDLWVRMLQNGAEAENLPQVLVYARIGNGMIARRGGIAYIRSAIALQQSFLKSGFISYPEFLTNCLIRIGIGLMPNGFRERFYRRNLRRKQ